MPEWSGKRWLHSHEEDHGDVRVYRPADFPFPRSRGRHGFELRDDGTAVEHYSGPDDRPRTRTGRWRAETPDRVRLSFPGERPRETTLEILESSPDRLLVIPRG
ncbi:hypothetical protein [Actinomadura miaoliensis]|uniref:Uncharacterized protein n=1 Tax=Actinomadura miaoliensis TaxID=430685 RepID=A0ABP7VAD6_9ACTN